MSPPHLIAPPGFALLLLAASASAHVPFIEKTDYTAAHPFEVNDVNQSKALYGWLENATDVDYFIMRVEAPTEIYTHTLVPLCPEYADFRVTYALAGPGLPEPDGKLPFELRAGEGAIVVRDASPDRPTNFEPFSGRSYYQGRELRWPAKISGEYRMIVWQEDGKIGDYVAVIGEEESFGPADFARAASGTVTLRHGGELHTACKPPKDTPADR